MPDPEGYLPDDVIYVKGYIRRKRRTTEQIEQAEQIEQIYQAAEEKKRKWGKIVWSILFVVGVSFLLIINPTWALNNFLLVIIIEVLFIVIAVISITIIRRNINRRFEEGYYWEDD